MTNDERKPGPNKAEHQRRAAEALRENLRRRKERQRKEHRREDGPAPADAYEDIPR